MLSTAVIPILRDFYPRSPCGERPSSTVTVILRKNFYPRSPCGERLNEDRYGQQYWRFLSTLSLRRATRGKVLQYAETPAFLSTLSLRRATIRKCQIIPIIQISIHALLAESDYTMTTTICIVSKFLSTLSLRRATCFSVPYRLKVAISIHALLAESDISFSAGREYDTISIHALLAESDIMFAGILAHHAHFYPRSPCGERRRSLL